MNADDFERHLRGQPLRPLPSEWRAEILAAAREAATVPQPDASGSLPFWRFFFARFPVAWGALAAVWAVMVAANFLASDASTPMSGLQAIANPEEASTVWRLQSVELRQLDGGEDAFSEHHPDIDPRQPALRPRSESLREDRIGESPFSDSSYPIV